MLAREARRARQRDTQKVHVQRGVRGKCAVYSKAAKAVQACV